ncbi:unnamed protein product, partial [Rotaria socialis]
MNKSGSDRAYFQKNHLPLELKVTDGIAGSVMECRDVDNAYRVFASITNKSNYSYTAMFKGLRSNGMPEKIIDLLEEMKIEPDNFTLTLSFHACAQVANERAMRIGQKLIHKLLNNSRNEDIVLN